MTSNLRIAVVANSISIHTTRWVNWLRENGHEVTVFSLIDGEDCVYFGPEPALDRSLIFNLGNEVRKTTTKLQQKIDEFKPNIVHGFYLINHGMYASRIESYPKVITALGSDVLIDPKESKLLSWIAKRTVKKSHSVFGPPLLTNEIKKWNLDTNLNDNFIGVDTSLFKPSEKTNTIVFARGFKQVYNPIVVAKAFESLSNKLKDHKFILCGNGPLKAETERILSNCKNIQFTGQISERELASIVGSAQLVISPSLSDSIPLTILEAVASGAPVIASNIPANQAWVDRELPVFLFKTGDSEDLAKKILTVIEDDSVLEYTIESGPKLIKENYSWEKEAGKVLKKYHDLVTQK